MRNRPEILAPAGSLDGVRAAVQNGADAVYMGFGRFNARRNARNFDEKEICQAISYCRERGVKTHITVNTLPSDREYQEVLQDVATVYRAGADALIVQDFGLIQVLHQNYPDIELHGSTQMTIHTLDGALAAKNIGMSRVVLARELSFQNIEYITKNCGIETEVFLHGALCMCYSGQCYLSSVIGQRSGNRGLCAQPCRLPYRFAGEKIAGYPLSLKDLSLLSHLRQLTKVGVASLKIEGRMKRPEYTAIVTKIYADILREEREPTQEERDILRRIFSRDGFTDGYFTGRIGASMFGTRTDIPLDQVKDLYLKAGQTFAEDREHIRFPADMKFVAQEKKPISLEMKWKNFKVSVQGKIPEKAVNKAITADDIKKNLEKFGGTVWKNGHVEIILKKGLFVRTSEINRLRRLAADQLLAKKCHVSQRKELPYSPRNCNRISTFRGYTVQVQSVKQVTDFMRKNKPECLYLPLALLKKEEAEISRLLNQEMPVCVVMPRIYMDEEAPEVKKLLNHAKEMGITRVMVANLGQIEPVKEMGFMVYGDYGLNVFNSECLFSMQKLGIERQTLSFELRLAQIRDLKKPIPTEILIYGYLPLMIFENCVIHNNSGCICKEKETKLVDRKGKQFSVIPVFGCRNELLNSQPIYFGEKFKDYQKIQVDYGRILFTKENPDICENIYRAILQNKPLEIPEGDTTNGLYYRGVK